MSLSSELVKTISDNYGFICLTGGGGKTTLMQLLAEEYKKAGFKVLMTTTTKIQSPEVYQWKCDSIFTDYKSIYNFKTVNPCTVLYAESSDIKGKLTSPSPDHLKTLKEHFDVVLCEADGSRQMPIKWHTEKDPVVPDFCTFTIALMGAWGNIPSLQDYIYDTQGLLKNTIKNRRAVVINGCECLPSDKTIIFSNVQWPSDCAILEVSAERNEMFRMY